MGKHERDWVEEAEKSVADGINGMPVDLSIQQICQGIREKITLMFPEDTIAHATWAGGSDYSDAGDVHVFLASGYKIRTELKFSFKNSSGTRKNPTTTILRKKINPTAKTYPELDRESGITQQRWQLVGERTGGPIRNASDYARRLRELRDANDPIIDQIVQITKPGQESYARYTAEIMNQNLDRVNKNIVDELLHPYEFNLNENDRNLLYCVIKKFRSDNQTVDFYDFTDMERTVVNVVSVGKSVKLLNARGKDVLRFSVNWKNICQGGATPCFNVFVGTAYQV